MIRNQHVTKLKILKIDNGLEFISKQFIEFCRKESLKMHKRVAHTSQPNFAKRTN